MKDATDRNIPHHIAVDEALTALRNHVQALKDDLRVTNELLAARQQVLDAIPPCREHGRGCVPHALHWIKVAASDMSRDDAKLTLITMVDSFGGSTVEKWLKNVIGGSRG